MRIAQAGGECLRFGSAGSADERRLFEAELVALAEDLREANAKPEQRWMLATCLSTNEQCPERPNAELTGCRTTASAFREELPGSPVERLVGRERQCSVASFAQIGQPRMLKTTWVSTSPPTTLAVTTLSLHLPGNSARMMMAMTPE